MPPSVVPAVMVLQRLEGFSDREAVGAAGVGGYGTGKFVTELAALRGQGPTLALSRTRRLIDSRPRLHPNPAPLTLRWVQQPARPRLDFRIIRRVAHPSGCGPRRRADRGAGELAGRRSAARAVVGIGVTTRRDETRT